MWEQPIIKFFNTLAITNTVAGDGIGANYTNMDVIGVATKTNPHLLVDSRIRLFILSRDRKYNKKSM